MIFANCKGPYSVVISRLLLALCHANSDYQPASFFRQHDLSKGFSLVTRLSWEERVWPLGPVTSQNFLSLLTIVNVVSTSERKRQGCFIDPVRVLKSNVFTKSLKNIVVIG